MAEENDKQEERTLEPSERRLEKAREEGQLPQSRDLTTFALIAVLPIAVIAFGPLFIDQTVKLVKDGLTFGAPDQLFDHIGKWGLGSFLWFSVVILLLVLPLWFVSVLSPLTLVSFKPYFVFKFKPKYFLFF